jgi:hypothetical protein
MKRVITILAIILFVIGGCKQFDTSIDEFITVDVTTSYPQKELFLQDFMDVEYVPLETSDEFITRANVQAIGKKIMIVRNRAFDGDIFIFGRNGRGLRTINQFGQSNKEYTSILGATLDEDNNEIFVNNFLSRNIMVYDLDGNFKRSFVYKKDDIYDISYDQISNFDRDNILCVDGANVFDDIDRNIFRIISKKDGSITKEIVIPHKEKKIPSLTKPGTTDDRPRARNWLLVPYGDSRILVETSSDTIYKLLPDYSRVPIIVRTPSIQSMNPEIYLFPGVFTERYYFMQAVKKVYDFVARTGFPRTDLMYDRQEKALYEYVVYNDDFSTKKPVTLAFEITPLSYDLVDDEIAFMEKLEAFDLVEAYKAGQLKGRLKEIAAELDEESNAVIMLAKHKK